MESPPAPTFVMIQSKSPFQFLVITFDPPSKFCQPNQLIHGRIGRHRGKPEFGGLRFASRPFCDQPFNVTRLMPVFISVGRTDMQGEESRSHLAARSFSPANILPHVLGSMSGKFQNRRRLMVGTASNSRGWATLPRPTPRCQRLHTRRPNCGFAAAIRLRYGWGVPQSVMRLRGSSV
jgi:hypothetical protein